MSPKREASTRRRPAERKPAERRPAERKPSEEVAIVVETVARLYSELYLLFYRRTDLREDRLTPQSLAVLQHLVFSGPLTVGEMAQHLDRAQSVVSETVDTLERRGLLARVRDERDRRRTLVWLTDAAHELLARMREVLDRERLSQAAQGMSNDERQSLVRGLQALVRAAERARAGKEGNP